MGRRRRVWKFVKYFVLLASQFSDQNRFFLLLCKPVLTEFVQTFPFFNSKVDYLPNSPHLWVVHLLQAPGAAPSPPGTDAGVSRCAPRPSADGEGDVPGRFSLPLALFPPCASALLEPRRRRKGENTELPVCVPRGARPAVRPWLGQGRFWRAERGVRALWEALAGLPGRRGRTWAHPLDLHLTLKAQSRKRARVRKGHVFRYDFFFSQCFWCPCL